MFRTDYEQETMPFVIEGEYTQVLGIGQVLGKIVVAHDPMDVVDEPIFRESGIIPVLLDEFAVTDEKIGCYDRFVPLLTAGLWAGFVTFGSSERIRSRQLLSQPPSHFMTVLRELITPGPFIAVIDNDEANATPFAKADLRSQLAMYDGMQAILTATSPNSATIEYALD